MRTIGCSLGDALALLTQKDLIKAGYKAIMINFRQPRVVDKDFIKFVKSKTSYSHRVTHHKDFMPNVPPCD